MKRKARLKIKAGVWQWLALACGCVGMMFGLGFAGDVDTVGIGSDTDFITAMVLLLAALLFIRLWDAATQREKKEAAQQGLHNERTYASVKPKKNTARNRHSA